MTGAYAPTPTPTPVMPPPRYCKKHDTSEKRVKGEARECSCKTCGITFMSTYAEMALCSACADRQKQCIICAAEAPNSSGYVPANVISNGNPTGGPPRGVSTEQLPAPPPRAGSMRDAPPAGRRQDPYSNLQPTDSIPVMQGKGNGAVPSTPKAPPSQRAPPRQQPPVAQRAPAPSTQQVFPRQRRGGPQQEEDDDENPVVLWLRKMNCGGAAGFFDDEDEPVQTRPQDRRPPPRGQPPRQG